MKPEIQNRKFKEFLRSRGAPDNLIQKITDRISHLNQTISNDKKNLGPSFQIGHSFFCPQSQNQKLDERWFEDVVNFEIASLLKEYWYDDIERVDAEVAKLVA